MNKDAGPYRWRRLALIMINTIVVSSVAWGLWNGSRIHGLQIVDVVFGLGVIAFVAALTQVWWTPKRRRFKLPVDARDRTD